MGRFDALELADVQPPENVAAPRHFGEALKDAQFFINAGDEHYFRLEYEEALKDYSAAVRIDPGANSAWRGQILCLIGLEEFREAELWLGKAVELLGENADFLALYALIHGRTGDWERACGYSDAAMEGSGESPLPLVVRGELLLYGKRNGEHCFERAWSLAPKWQTALLIAEGALFSRRRPGALLALKYVREALATEFRRPELYLELVKIYNILNRPAEAREAAAEAASLCGELRMLPRLTANIKDGFFRRLRRWFS